MNTAKIPEHRKGAQMNAIEAMKEASLLCFDVRQAHETLDKLLTGREGSARFDSGLEFVEARLEAALIRVRKLRGRRMSFRVTVSYSIVSDNEQETRDFDSRSEADAFAEGVLTGIQIAEGLELGERAVVVEEVS